MNRFSGCESTVLVLERFGGGGLASDCEADSLVHTTAAVREAHSESSEDSDDVTAAWNSMARSKLARSVALSGGQLIAGLSLRNAGNNEPARKL